MPGLFACCCGHESEDDEERLVREGQGNNHAHNNLPTSSSRNDGRSPSPDYSESNGGGSIPNGKGNTQHDDEQAILHRILEETQNSIIDVGALDQQGPGPEFAIKAAKYEELIRQGTVSRSREHKSSIRGASKGPSRMTSDAIASLQSNIPNQASTSCLRDTGSRITEILSNPPMVPEQLTQFRNLSSEMSTAVDGGVQVVHQEDLVVHLNPT